jgi:flavodoxin
MTEKCLIVYYSKTGNTKKIAEAVAEKLGGDLCEVNEQGTAQASDKNPSSYDLVVVGTPVNGFRASLPIQGYLTQNRDKLPDVAFYVTYSLWPAGTLGGMEKLAGKKPIASETFKAKDIIQGRVDEKVNGFVDALRAGLSRYWSKMVLNPYSPLQSINGPY